MSYYKILISHEELEEGLKRLRQAQGEGKFVELDLENRYHDKSGRQLLRLKIDDEEVFIDGTDENLADVERYIIGNEAYKAGRSNAPVYPEGFEEEPSLKAEDGYLQQIELLDVVLEGFLHIMRNEPYYDMRLDEEGPVITLTVVHDRGRFLLAFDYREMTESEKKYFDYAIRRTNSMVAEFGYQEPLFIDEDDKRTIRYYDELREREQNGLDVW